MKNASGECDLGVGEIAEMRADAAFLSEWLARQPPGPWDDCPHGGPDESGGCWTCWQANNPDEFELMELEHDARESASWGDMERGTQLWPRILAIRLLLAGAPV